MCRREFYNKALDNYFELCGIDENSFCSFIKAKACLLSFFFTLHFCSRSHRRTSLIKPFFPLFEKSVWCPEAGVANKESQKGRPIALVSNSCNSSSRLNVLFAVSSCRFASSIHCLVRLLCLLWRDHMCQRREKPKN